MIEKFSDEELKQIKKDLGLSSNIGKREVCRTEVKEMFPIFSENSKRYQRGNVIKSMYRIVDVTIGNYDVDKDGFPKFKNAIKEELIDEYRQMFQEILEIIKKHNRKWGGEERSSE